MRHVPQVAHGLALTAVLAASCGPESRTGRERQAAQLGGSREVLRDKPIAWLPDGDRLVFQRVSELVSGDVVTPTCAATGLYTIRVNPTASQETQWRSGKVLCDILWHVDRGHLSPDSRSLLYANSFAGGRIERIDLEDLSIAIVAAQCLPIRGAPAWSPDGRLIAFVANCRAPQYPLLHLMNSDDSRIRPVGKADSVSDGSPSWSPSGRELVFTRVQRARQSDVMITDTLGAERKLIARGFSQRGVPGGIGSRTSPTIHNRSLHRRSG